MGIISGWMQKWVLDGAAASSSSCAASSLGQRPSDDQAGRLPDEYTGIINSVRGLLPPKKLAKMVSNECGSLLGA